MIKFTKITFLFFAAVFVLTGVSFGQGKESKNDDESELQIPVTLSYSSVYWRRGTVVMEEAGVFWPGVGAVFGDSGIELNIAAGISENLFTKEGRITRDAAKSYAEIDYNLSYSSEMDKILYSLSLLYYQYPYYDEVDPEAADPSFAEGTVSVGLNTLLSPTIEFSYDYYIEARKGIDAKDVPVAEDYYAKFSISHDIVSSDDGFTFSAEAYIGYYNDPYWEAKGLSDGVVSLEFSKDNEDLTMSSTFYYGRTIGRDFKNINEGYGVTVKNHFWCDFGLTYSL